MITFSPVFAVMDAPQILYDILKERKSRECIRHKTMPTYEEHIRFMDSNPYAAWYLIHDSSAGWVGHINLSHTREVGIFLFAAHRGKGYGEEAIRRLAALHPGTMYAEINPLNAPSIVFFTGLGGKLIQHTYEFTL